MYDGPLPVRRLRLRNPDPDFPVDVTLTEKDGRWLAVTMLADAPDTGTGKGVPARARPGALWALGGP